MYPSHTGAAPSPASWCCRETGFNLRPQARGISLARFCHLRGRVSIHAPHAGATGANMMRRSSSQFQFTPPTRGGGDMQSACHSCHSAKFQSTPPPRGATTRLPGLLFAYAFQSTPLTRGRPQGMRTALCALLFQSTPPAQGATSLQISHIRLNLFQSTPPARGATRSRTSTIRTMRRFNPRPPRGGRRDAGARYAG